MNRQGKLVAWGRERLERHQQEMEKLLEHLHEEQQVSGEESNESLTEIVQAIETQKIQTESTLRRLTPSEATLTDPAAPRAVNAEEVGTTSDATIAVASAA